MLSTHSLTLVPHFLRLVPEYGMCEIYGKKVAEGCRQAQAGEHADNDNDNNFSLALATCNNLFLPILSTRNFVEAF